MRYREFLPDGETRLIYSATAERDKKPIFARALTYVQVVDGSGGNAFMKMGEADLYSELERLAFFDAKIIQDTYGREVVVVTRE